MRRPRHPAFIAVAMLVAVAGCDGSEAPTETDANPPTSTSTHQSPTGATAGPVSSPTHEPDETLTTDPPADPPPEHDVAPPIEGATVAVSPTTVRVGDEITVTVSCPQGDLNADIWFDQFRANHLLIKAPMTTEDPTLYEYQTTTVVPYYLDPGTSIVQAGCIEGVRDPEAEIEILPSLNGYDELWRPIQYPWIEPDRQPGTPPPEPVDEAYGDGFGIEIPVHALCDRSIPRSGARFIVWTPIVTDDDFLAVEFPVADNSYDPIDQGVVISTKVVADRDIFTVDGTYDPPRVSALCVATATPFTPEAEPGTPQLFAT